MLRENVCANALLDLDLTSDSGDTSARGTVRVSVVAARIGIEAALTRPYPQTPERPRPSMRNGPTVRLAPSTSIDAARTFDPPGGPGNLFASKTLITAPDVTVKLGVALREEAGVVTEAELIAAIHADLDDDATRMVYADWLAGRGDPRGELIAIQLAPPTNRGRRREAELLAAHGAAWLGRVALVAETYELRRGFLAAISPTRDDDAFDDPVCATVEELDFRSYTGTRELELLERLPAVRTVHNLEQATMVALATGPARPRLRDVGFRMDLQRSADERALIGNTAALPSVVRLSMFVWPSDLRGFLCGRLARQLERLTLVQDSTVPELAELVAIVDELGLAIPELAVASDDGDVVLLDRRTRELRATVMHVHGVTRQLAHTHASAVRVELRAGGSVTRDDIRHFEREVAGLALRAEVPWERFDAQQVPDGVAALTAELAVDRERVVPLVDLVVAPPISLAFDSYEDDARRHTALVRGLAQVRELVAVPSRSLHVYARGRIETCDLRVDRSGFVQITTAYDLRREAPEPLIAWFERVLDATRWQVASVRFCVPASLWFYMYPPQWDHWLLALPASLDPRLPFDLLEAFAEDPELAWLRTRRAQDRLLMVHGDGPDHPPTAAQFEHYMRAVHELQWRTRGFHPHDIFIEMLGPRLEDAGFQRVALETRDALAGDVAYQCERCIVELSVGEPWADALEPSLHMATLSSIAPGRRSRVHSLVGRPVRSAGDLRAVCEDYLARFDADVLAWFDLMVRGWR